MKFRPWWRPGSAWADELDFVGPRVRTAPWAWGALLLSLVVLGVVAATVAEVDQSREEAQQALRRLQRAAHQQALETQARARVASHAGPQQALSSDQMHHAVQLAQWLGYPWLEVLDQADQLAVAQRAVLLSFSLDLAALGGTGVAQPEVRVSAAVRDDAAALRWALSQGPSAQLLSRVKLGSAVQTRDGSYEWRAEASWNGAQP